ncbi:MAG: UbiA family prenyltransferase [candidate division WOR-3 bacterium]|nr:UbiA family prenyltransferase [candidate division WOR-3 bacterium]
MNSKVKTNILDYFFLLRPFILIPVINFFLIGNYIAGGSGFEYRVLSGLLLYTLMMGGVYILNQITDIETDRLNKKLFLLSENYLPMKHAYIEMFLIWGTVLFFSYRFGYQFFIIIIISLILGILYSLPPFKLKGKPILDTLSNGFGYGILNFSAGWLMQRALEWGVFLRFLPYFFSISAIFINTTIVDMEGDKKAGAITTSVFLGAKFSYVISSLLILIGLVFSIFYEDYICLISSALSLPIFLYTTFYFLKKKEINRKITILSFRLPGLIFTFITCILYPWFLPIFLFLILVMRIYYKKRFNIDYPSLSQG